MSKLSSLYYAHLKEREELMGNYINGTDTVKKLHEFLQLKLNAKDYSTAEELLNAVISETEEQGFTAGRKYTFGLGLELTGQTEE